MCLQIGFPREEFEYVKFAGFISIVLIHALTSSIHSGDSFP